ncbi:MAG: hypothetical protein Q8R37_01035 [Nanoarchaeota archaeon]|nr:hypothetical protein [Nanoarchaeota archaeon]
MGYTERAVGAAIAGAVAIVAVSLLAKPLLEAFSQLALGATGSTTLIVGLILLAVGVAIFQKMTRR